MAGTITVCVLAAFGAAFLVVRAFDHQGPARTPKAIAKATRVAATSPKTTNVALASQFTPGLAALKAPAKHRRKARHLVHRRVAVATSAPAAPAPTPGTPAPARAHASSPSTYVPPRSTYVPPTSTPLRSAPTGRSGGSGSTSVGGSGRRRSGGGSGTTTIG